MRIAMIGAGAMGGVFGARLASGGARVTFVDRDAAHVAAIRARGLSVSLPGGDLRLDLSATDDIGSLAGFDLAIVLVPGGATAGLAPQLPRVLAPGGAVLTLQNGIGNVEALAAALGTGRVLAGSTYASSAFVAPGAVRQTNAGETVLGESAGGLSERATGLAARFTEAGLPTVASANVMGHVWSKFALNCALNPLSALTGLRPGEVVRQGEMAALLDTLIAEILAVVAAKGIVLPEPDPAAHIRDHAFVRYNRPSMLQHVEAGRPTEIGSLNGALVAEASRLGMPVPANAAVAALVRGIEARLARPGGLDDAALEAAARREAEPGLTPSPRS